MKKAMITLGILLYAPSAFAQCPSGPLARSLAQQTPIGQYAKDVVTRANDGIARAKQEAGNASGFDIFFVHWVGSITSVLLSLVDTKITVSENISNLERITACMDVDVAIIEAKIEEARCELNAALDAKSPGAILRLNSLIQFLNNRLGHLLQGGLDPKYEDQGWQTWYFFDDPFNGWCCLPDSQACVSRDYLACTQGVPAGNFYARKNECFNEDVCTYENAQFSDEGNPAYQKACPFDSDYLAPSTSGYGCHPDKLANFVAGMGLDETKDSATAEKKALEKLNEERDEFISNVGHIKDIVLAIDQFMNRASDPRLAGFGDTKTDSIQYKKVSGCDADTPIRQGGPKPSASWAAISLRSPFSLGKQQLVIWDAFLRLMHRYAGDREYPDYLKQPKEFWTEAERQSADTKENALAAIPRDYLRKLWKEFSLWQASFDSAAYPKVIDSPQQMLTTLSPVRTAMRTALTLLSAPGTPVGTGKSMRTFVRDYAYFLRRTCLDRPCKTQLESVLKIIFQDDCFPYGSSKYLQGGTSWEKCKSAAGL